ncbi:MAG: carboxylating nicotinate-nucleotide diphosphorylase [Rhodothermales bacterium]|nr:carboxylating nicotinate-nucleotide diphosphorylase [Rhodothermales bacterium]
MIPDYVNIDDLMDLIDLALREDVGTGDVTSNSTIDSRTKAKAIFTAKEPGVVAGLELADLVFESVDSRLSTEWFVTDGDPVSVGDELGTVEGNARSILLAERLVLNFMQRMGGIASATRKMVERVKPYGTQILDTRKTAPGLRSLDKWAVLLGGGSNHRLGLYDMVLIKDNHIAACGGVESALTAASDIRKKRRGEYAIEIEAKHLDQVRDIVATGLADVIMLDNMVTIQADGSVDTSRLDDAVKLVGGQLRTEASGNVTLDTVGAIASTGVDAISSGSLTHSVRALDISLNVHLRDLNEA